jgi:hypothetical protein
MKELNEQDLFDILKKIIPDLEKRNPFSFRDAYSKKHNLSIELKCRHTHYKNLIVEKVKWDSLIVQDNVRYINSTPKGVYSFDIKNIKEPEWFDKILPAQTEFVCKEKVTKKVGLLNINLAKEITNLIYETKENTLLV